jgi:hypothetical protein
MMIVEVNGSPVAIDLKFGVAEVGIKKNGEKFDNGQYKALNTVINEYKTGDRVQVTASFSRNEYATEEGEIKSYPTVYFERVTRSNVPAEDEISGSLIGVVTRIDAEAVDGEPTGRLSVGLATVTYNGELEQFDFIVEKELANDFKKLYSQNSVAQLYYTIKSNKVVVEEVEESTGGFGQKAKKTVRSRSFTEYVIIGGEPANDPNKDGFNEDLFITSEEVAEGKTKREISQQKKIQKKLDKANGGNGSVKGSAPVDSTPANLPF